MERRESTDRLYIQMFSHFSISGMGGHLEEDNMRSEMLTKLFAYFICHRKKEISTQELVDALWQGEESDNPTGALKNLVYRLRTRIKEEWGGIDFIQTGRGSYRWNENIPAETDAEIFESYYELGKRETDEEKKLEAWLKACDLYKGEFLPKLTGEYWIASMSAYYHSLYITSVKQAAALLEKMKRDSDTIRICTEALLVDALDETVYGYLIRALVHMGDYKTALERYKTAAAHLYESLGVSPSEELRATYEEILKQTHTEEKNIGVIHNELEDDELEGAFLCEYGVFKKTYHLEKRRSERLGISVYLVLLTVEPIASYNPESQAYLNVINEGMEQVEAVLLSSLRSGDVIARYSGSQYIIMLPTCQYESAKMVMERVNAAFERSFRKRKVRLQYSLDEMGTGGQQQ